MERILCIFEGVKTERLYFDSIQNAFFDSSEVQPVVFLSSFGNDLYELYKELEEDDDLDIFELVKELNPESKNDPDLESLDRDDINQIYLFFDLECQDDKFCPTKLLQLLRLFDNETEKGKLFISYPMVEAIRDFTDSESFMELVVPFNDCKGKIYKGLSAKRGENSLQQPRKMGQDIWFELISVHLRKANILVNDTDQLSTVTNQSDIAEKQNTKYLCREQVLVLSAFPIFVADYFGYEYLDSEYGK